MLSRITGCSAASSLLLSLCLGKYGWMVSPYCVLYHARAPSRIRVSAHPSPASLAFSLFFSFLLSLGARTGRVAMPWHAALFMVRPPASTPRALLRPYALETVYYVVTSIKSINHRLQHQIGSLSVDVRTLLGEPARPHRDPRHPPDWETKGRRGPLSNRQGSTRLVSGLW